MNINGGVVPLYRIGMDNGPQSHQTVTFRDGEESWTAAIPGTMDATSNLAMQDDVSLSEFMGRPIKIASYTWDPTAVTDYYQVFDPWSLFFGNKRVINRINNYNNMQAKLKVKIMINGNPFYYGRLMAEYFVRPFYDQLTPRQNNEENLIFASQRLKIFIDPTTSQGGQLHLPMILQNNAFSVPNADWDLQGRIYLREVSGLKHANGGTEPLSISVYAWAENVKLSIPTVANSDALVFQGSEYKSKPVSNLMSNIAKAAGSLSNIPWISPYAKATEMVSSGLGQVATIFGFSRPAIIENPTIIKRAYMGNLCNTDRGDTCTRLTLDSKQELTVDPTTIGVAAQDEMNISAIVTKECYLTKIPWATTNVVDDKLFTVLVTPHLARRVNDIAMYNTPMATVANLFDYWRGSIDFRFQIIASQYHKGRLLFVFDPRTNSLLPEQNVQYSRIIDLSDERDFTMKVCWGQNKTYLPLIDTIVYSNQYVNGNVPLPNVPWTNGFLSVYVLNELTTPNSTVNNDIEIAVYVSGGDDLEFNVLSEKIRTSSYLPQEGVTPGLVADTQELTFQGDSISPKEKPVETMDELGENAPQNEIVKECVADEIQLDHSNDVFFGESIASIRSLMKRYVFAGGIRAFFSTSGAFGIRNTYVDYNFPRYRGYAASAVTPVSDGQANIVNTSVMNYMAPCYTGYRGSMRVKYIVDIANTQAASTKMYLHRKATTGSGYSFTNTTFDMASTAGAYAAGRQIEPSGLSGMEMVGCDIHPALEAELPHYSNLRYFHTKQIVTPSEGDYDFLRHQLELLYCGASTTKTGLMKYVSVGEDFQLFLYQGQPPLFDIPSFTLPA